MRTRYGVERKCNMATMYGIFCKRDNTVFNITNDKDDVIKKCNEDNDNLIKLHGAKTLWYIPVKVTEIESEEKTT